MPMGPLSAVENPRAAGPLLTSVFLLVRAPRGASLSLLRKIFRTGPIPPTLRAERHQMKAQHFRYGAVGQMGVVHHVVSASGPSHFYRLH